MSLFVINKKKDIMKIINVDRFLIIPGISVDNIIVDNSAIITDDNYIRVTPRYACDNVILKFYNEVEEKFNIYNSDVINENGYMTIPFYNDNNFKEGESYEIFVYDSNNDKLIWRGKGLVTSSDDLQNYKLIEKNINNKIIL